MATNDHTVPYRVKVLEKRTDAHAKDIDELWKVKAEKDDLHLLADKVDGLRRVLVGMTITIAVAAIVFALGILQFMLTSGIGGGA